MSAPFPYSSVFIAGHNGLVGSALQRRFYDVPNVKVHVRSHTQLDLTDEFAVDNTFAATKPDCVFLAAAKVGGIVANRDYPVEFLETNLAIQTAVIRSAFRHKVRKLVFLGSSCIYPRNAPQPIPESALMSGPLEPTNDAYALAKLAGLRLCRAYREQHGCDFVAAMPTNLYGPNDNYHPTHSHVIPGLIRRFHEAKQHNLPSVECWGTGNPLREFMHADDCAEALFQIAAHYSEPEPINVGSGEEISIQDLTELVADAVGYQGTIAWDRNKPDGTPRKLVDCTKLKRLGFAPKISLAGGLPGVYSNFLSGGCRL